jgi:predicted Rossmann-fold nucleotide-binding protein
MKRSIGVMRSSGGPTGGEMQQRAYRLGEALGAPLSTSIRSCDMVVIVGGRTGTLGELAHSRKPSCFYDAKAEAT